MKTIKNLFLLLLLSLTLSCTETIIVEPDEPIYTFENWEGSKYWHFGWRLNDRDMQIEFEDNPHPDSDGTNFNELNVYLDEDYAIFKNGYPMKNSLKNDDFFYDGDSIGFTFDDPKNKPDGYNRFYELTGIVHNDTMWIANKTSSYYTHNGVYQQVHESNKLYWMILRIRR